MSKKMVIIGGGASGYFCAVNVARLCPNLEVIIFEKQSKVLQKVKVSGGGRCNVTHACFQNSELVKKYPRGKSFLKKTLSFFSPKETISWFAQRNVALKVEPDGRMFPESNDSQSIIDCLLKESDQYGVKLNLHAEVIEIKKNDNQFEIFLKNGQSYKANYVMIACGGFPKEEQYSWIKQLGHSIELPAPSLFTFNTPKSKLNELMGLVCDHSIVKIVDSKLQEQGPILITHWGLSGPAILRLSAWGALELKQKNYEFEIIINWLGIPENKIRDKWNSMRDTLGSRLIWHKNPFQLPNRLWHFLLQEIEIPKELKWSELPSKSQNKLIHILTTHLIKVQGKTTFKEEFVTCGGVELSEIDASSCQSKLVPNLFFGGEILNVDGITGGFNFQHAWSSGFIVANSIANKINEGN